MKRVGVFGGSFDPPHVGHQHVTQAILQQAIVDEVWLLPVQNHPFNKSLTAASHRLAMLELMVSDIADDRVSIEAFELAEQSKNYTYSTLIALQARHPECELAWVMGSDQLASFHTWYRAKELVQEFEVLVFPRVGGDVGQAWPRMTVLESVPTMTASSTQARQLLVANEDTSELVLPQVAAYSKFHHLYD